MEQRVKLSSNIKRTANQFSEAQIPTIYELDDDRIVALHRQDQSIWLSLFEWSAQDATEDVLEQIGTIKIGGIDRFSSTLTFCAFGFDEVRRKMFVTIAATYDNAYTSLYTLSYGALCQHFRDKTNEVKIKETRVYALQDGCAAIEVDSENGIAYLMSTRIYVVCFIDSSDANDHTTVGPYSYNWLIQNEQSDGRNLHYMGIKKALRPREFVLSLGYIVLYVEFDKVLGGLKHIEDRATIKTGNCWVATEIDLDTLALGFYGHGQILIYKSGLNIKTVTTKTVDGFYGIITPPITWGPTTGTANPLLLCLDNNSCVLADLRHDKPKAEELFKFKTGIGGFMPRYLARASTQSSFSVLIIQLHSPMSTVAEYNLLSYKFRLETLFKDKKTIKVVKEEQCELDLD